MSVIKPATFNPALLTISEAKKLDNGSSQAYINYGGKRLRIQAPRMPIPMDASDYKDNGKFKVQLSFKEKDSNPKVAAYFKALEDIDNFIINHAQEKSGPWFKKPGMARDLVVDKFTPSIKYSKDKEGNLKPYPPSHSIALKKNVKTGTFDAELYDKEKRLIEGATPIEVLRRGAEITSILECTGIWITDKGFGATWKLFQAVVDVNAEGMEVGCAIQDDDEEDAPVRPAAKAAPKVSNIVDDDEEEDILQAVKPAAKPAEVDVEDDEVVEAPPVAAKVVKKVIKKVVPKA
jgi:hypothetical protein